MGNARNAIESMELGVEKLRMRVEVPRNVLVSVEEPADYFMRDVVLVRMMREIATIPGERSLTVPDGWWQAWKEANLDVLLRFFPVRYRTYEALGFLPNFELPRGMRPVVARWREKERNGE